MSATPAGSKESSDVRSSRSSKHLMSVGIQIPRAKFLVYDGIVNCVADYNSERVDVLCVCVCVRVCVSLTTFHDGITFALC